MKIKKGDLVAIIAGKDQFETNKKGEKLRKTGKVLKVYPKDRKVIVEGVNKVKKHEGPTQQNEEGRILDIEAPIDISNVAYIDPKEKVPTKIGYKIVNDKKVRYAKRSGTIIDK